MNTDILLLNRSQIASLLTLPACIDAMHEAFRLRAENKTLPPELMHVDADGGEFHIKGGGLKLNETYFALKANGGFFQNRVKFDLPNIIGLILLFDGQCGRPLAILDSTYITITRTGATTALAAKFLARPDSTTVTICGCGNQGRIQLTALKHIFPNLNRAFAWDASPPTAEKFAADMAQQLHMQITAESDLANAAPNSDIIVTCTPAKGFFLRKSHVRPGTFISAVGADSPEKQELEPAFLAGSKLVVDILDQCAHVGELHHAIDAKLMTTQNVYAELSEIVAQKIPGRTSPTETIIFDTTGSALQDAAAAALVYQNALAQKIGQSINLYQ